MKSIMTFAAGIAALLNLAGCSDSGDSDAGGSAGAGASGGAAGESTGGTANGGAGGSQAGAGGSAQGGSSGETPSGGSGGHGNAGAGTGGAAGSGGAAGTGGTGGTSPQTGRPFVLGMYQSGKTSGDYHAWLGYYPEATYDQSFQQHWPGGKFYLPNKKYPIVLEVDIAAYGTKIPYDEVASGMHDAELIQTRDSIPTDWYDWIYAIRIDAEYDLVWEGNGPFYAQFSPEDYKAAWDHVAALYRAKLPARVKYIYNPNCDPPRDLTNRVPDSADIIGLDAYANPTWNKTSAYMFGDKGNPGAGTIWWWTAKAKQLGKPIALPEWGDDYADGELIRDVAAWANDRDNNVVYLGYWDSNLNEDATLRGASYDAFQEVFGNQPYGGTYFTLLPTPNDYPGF